MSLTTTLVQIDTVWEDAEASVAGMRKLLSESKPAPGSLVVLPEMFATGFTFDETAVRAAADPAHDALRDLARESGCFVIGGVAGLAEASRDERWGVNEALAFDEAGAERCRYRKVRTFSYTDESVHYRRGDEVLTFDWAGWRICPLICYDLRFPELFHAGLDRGAELFVVIANWPIAREDHWVTLLRARAIENQAWVVGVNRAGADPTYAYPGRSLVVDPHGDIRCDAGRDAGVVTCELDRDVLTSWREEFPAWKDRL